MKRVQERLDEWLPLSVIQQIFHGNFRIQANAQETRDARMSKTHTLVSRSSGVSEFKGIQEHKGIESQTQAH